MIAPSKPLSRFEAGRSAAMLAAPAERHDHVVGVAVGALGFACFMPYPALPVGNNTAVQAGNVLAGLLIVPFLTLPWGRRAMGVYPLILAPLLLAILKVAVTGNGDVALCFKSTLVWAVSCLALVAAQLYAPAYALELLTGIALATLVHVAVGVWQFAAFSSGGEFPLVDWYVNPSFLSVQENARTIARYTRRPFGLFPEPSAMASSLAPWVLFWAAEVCGVVRLRRAAAKWQRALFVIASLGGVGLIIVSQSGHAAVTAAGLLGIAAIWFVRSSATARVYGGIVLVFGLLLPLLVWFAGRELSNRLGGSEMGNSSWAERTASLRIGFAILLGGEAMRVVFGVGPGLMAPALSGTAGIDAVFSVLLTYVYETGLVGLLVVAWVGGYLLRVWKFVGWNAAFGLFGLVWLVGVTLTTSYEQLLPLWLAVGWLTVWPEVCASGIDQPARVPVAQTVATPSAPMPRSRWGEVPAGAAVAACAQEATA
ncbi:MAG TPA: hypothetical protein VH475_18105 [Tepidisphaeraceae bacterium]|jgi:hypothetical protein